MKVILCSDKNNLGLRAAEHGARIIREALAERGSATIVVATGASQFDTLSALVKVPDVEWSRVTAFHLDEYVGISATHPASFRRYLKERFVDQVPINTFHYVNGEGRDGTGDVIAECYRLAELIRGKSIDVAFVGIGENGHLAFNDPPADFDTEEPYVVVNLDIACRRQQLSEGWFSAIDDVPRQAISISIRQIMKSRHIIVSAPDVRKAVAVQAVVEGVVSPDLPSSILQQHEHATLYLDPPSASLLRKLK